MRAFIVVAVSAVLAVSCGKSASDAEKKTVGAAMSALTDTTPQSRMMATARRVAEEFEHRSCSAGTFTVEEVKFTVTCPTSGDDAGFTVFTMEMTGDGEAQRTGCGTTVTIKDLAATYKFKVTRPSTSMSSKGDFSVKINGDEFKCKYSAAITIETETSGSSTSVDTEYQLSDYSCTYKGAPFSEDDFKASIGCKTR